MKPDKVQVLRLTLERKQEEPGKILEAGLLAGPEVPTVMEPSVGLVDITGSTAGCSSSKRSDSSDTDMDVAKIQAVRKRGSDLSKKKGQ
ncbi:hypothetical protein VZT92_022127 [Zoarces viviparus]